MPPTRLDDLYYYAMVVRHGGFAAAGRALGVPKSRLSRHVNTLEEQLGVRLLQRSTRRFVVTDTGQQLFRHCEAMLAQAEAALEVVETARSEPRGRIRVACPVAVAENMLAPVLPGFLARHPQVRVDLVVSNRRVDLLGEGFDAALRVRTAPSGEDGVVMRSFAELCELLVASPAYLAAAGVPEVPASFRRIGAGDPLRIGAHDWIPVIGRGHCPEHACLWAPSLNVLIAGDILLPRISPNVSVWPAEPHANPLAAYLGSLGNFANVTDDALTLPAHGLPYRGVHNRIAQLRAHHRGGLDALAAALTAEGLRATDCFTMLFKRPIGPHNIGLAIGEALAHLHFLETLGRARRVRDAAGVWRFARP